MATSRRSSFSVGTPSGMPIINALRSAIRQVESDRDKLGYDVEALLALSVECNIEQILVGRKVKTVRKVYMCGSSKAYKVGWILDGDTNCCLICLQNFSWVRLKHHCRACGMVVCHKCSKYKTNIQVLQEEGGSRVCTNCFGLKVEVDPYFFPKSPILSPDGLSPTSSGKYSAIQQRKFVVKRRNTNKASPMPSDSTSSGQTSTAGSTTASDVDSNSYSSLTASDTNSDLPTDETSVMFKKLQEFEQQQLPKYKEAYREMREIIPPNITKTKLKKILNEGIPRLIAKRIWDTKALWLICMHRDDIKKVHVGDLRGKYNFHTLDLTELRAVWYALPDWNEVLYPAKAEWKEGLKLKMDDMSYKLSIGQIDIRETRNPIYLTQGVLKIYDPDTVIQPRFGKSASYSRKTASPTDSITNSSNNVTPLDDSLSPLLRQMTAPRSVPVKYNPGPARKFTDLSPLVNDNTDTPRRKITFDGTECTEDDNTNDSFSERELKSISEDDYSLDALLLESKTYRSTHLNSSAHSSFVTDTNLSFALNQRIKTEDTLDTITSDGDSDGEDDVEVDVDGDDCMVGINSSTYKDFHDSPKSFCDVLNTSHSSGIGWNEFSEDDFGFSAPRINNTKDNSHLMTISEKNASIFKKLTTVSNDDGDISEEEDFSPISITVTPDLSPTGQVITYNITPFSTLKPQPQSFKKSWNKSPEGIMIKSTMPFDNSVFHELMLCGKAEQASLYLKKFNAIPTKEQATKLLMDCVREADTMEDPVNTFIILVEKLKVDVNDLTLTGRSPLSILFANKELGSYLMSHGADVLLEDRNGTGSCPLSLSMEFRIPWMLREFEESGKEKELFDSENEDRIKSYAACLLLGGYFSKVESILLDGYADFTPREASELMRKCCDNFDNLDNPGDAFELLIALDADRTIIKRFVTGLILVGYGVKAAQILATGQVGYTVEEATELLSSCSGNFEQMHEPMETFELLERLGAEM